VEGSVTSRRQRFDAVARAQCVNVPETVATVVDREFAGSDIHGVEQLSGGCKDTYRVELTDSVVVVASPREAWYERQFALEPALMRLVRRETSVPVPRVLASDISGTRCRPYHVTAAVDAEDLHGRFATLDRETQVALVGTLGATLAALHRSVRFDAPGPLRPATDRGVTVDARRSWPAFLAELVGGWIDDLDGGRFADLKPTYRRVLTPESFLSVDVEPVCLHFDYSPGNLLTRGETLAGVVDWGFAVAGHAEYDLFEFEKNVLLGELDDEATREALRPHLYAGYRRTGELEPGWKRRRAFYRVAYKLASMQSFHRWTAEMTRVERDAMAAQLRTELETDLDSLRRWRTDG
jgi:aminoglycoside phosphotransferase (APT) family kinase protein